MPDTPDPNASKPLVMIPMTAEDAARRKRKIVTYCVSGVVLIAALSAWIYNRSLDPLRAQGAYDAGRRLLSVARYSEAILSFDQAIGLKPDLADAYLLRGRARVAVYDSNRAIQDFSKVIELRPRDAEAYIERSRAHLLFKNYPAAIADSTAVLALDPKLAVAYNLRGTAVRDSGDPKRALQDFDRAVELSPNADNYFQRGATHQLLGEHKLAIADFDQTIAFEPSFSQGYFARAESERALGEANAAQRDHLQGRILDGR